MRQFIIAFATLVAVANASIYGGGGGGAGYGGGSGAGSGAGYGAAPAHPPIIYNIPPPAVFNPVPGPLPGPLLKPIGIDGSISGSGTPSALIGIGSNPSAAASAASANVPLKPGSYKLLVVPSYVVSNLPGRVAPRGGYGGRRY